MISKFPNSRGFAILYAVLMVSIVLTISLTLLDISYKQLILSSINKESKMAYYAAVNALNCATYWDKIAADNTTPYDSYYAFGYFDSGSFIPPSGNQSKLIRCVGNASINVAMANQTFVFTVSFPQASADVTVIKGNGSNNAASGVTLIKVDGYNTSDSNNPRRVQRSLDSS